MYSNSIFGKSYFIFLHLLLYRGSWWWIGPMFRWRFLTFCNSPVWNWLSKVFNKRSHLAGGCFKGVCVCSTSRYGMIIPMDSSYILTVGYCWILLIFGGWVETWWDMMSFMLNHQLQSFRWPKSGRYRFWQPATAWGSALGIQRLSRGSWSCGLHDPE